jgi:Sulfotransferase family
MALFSRPPNAPPDHPPAPFIVGVPRSGTTLLRLALDAHPELAIPPETGFLLPLFARSRWRLPRLDRAAFYDHVTRFHTWPDLGLDAAVLRRALAALDPFSLAAGVRCLFQLVAAQRGKRRWGDKTPTYGTVLPRLRRLLPEARFVHLIRDGRDVALSLGKVWFSPSDELSERAAHWAREVAAIRRAGRGDRAYLEVHYEDLVSEPRSTLERICSFLALEYSETMARSHETAAERLGLVTDLRRSNGQVVTRAERLGQHRLTSSPPTAERIGVWRREMTPKQVASFEQVAGAALEACGYETSRRRPR